MREVNPASRSHAAPSEPGCPFRHGGGEPLEAITVRRERGDGTFTPGDSAHVTHFATVSSVLGATDGGFATPPRTRRSRRAMAFGASTLWRAALTGRPASMVRAWLAACPPSGERGLSQAARSERNAREAEANGIGAGGDALTPRTGEDRTLEVMLARRHRCRSRSDVARRREAGALHFTRSGSVRGRSPSPQAHVRKCDPEDEEAAAHPRSGSIT